MILEYIEIIIYIILVSSMSKLFFPLNKKTKPKIKKLKNPKPIKQKRGYL